MRTTVLYIPGLGDGYDHFRCTALRFWSLFGVQAVLVPITWYDGADFDAKYQRITQAVKGAQPGRVVLIGESAGATLALHAAADAGLPIDSIITLCGVARRATPISSRIRRRAPALDQAVRTIPEAYRVPVLSLRAMVDHVVGRRSSTAVGADSKTIWSVGHLTTILLCLTILAPYMSKLARGR